MGGDTVAIVPRWNPAASWMHFPELTASGSAVPVYTLAWRIEDHPDEWSNRLAGFKGGNPRDVRGAAHVLRVAIPSLMDALRISKSAASLTVALSSRSRRINIQAPLARVGEWLARHIGIEWLPHLFKKEPHRALHLLGSGAERDSEVEGKYIACGTVDRPVLFILDDLTTRGATFDEMRRALHVQQPELRVIGLALGKNERKDFAAGFGVTVNNDHVPAAWAEVWEK